jgi:hypothetical protein
VVELFTVVNAHSPLAGVRLPHGSPCPSHSSVSARPRIAARPPSVPPSASSASSSSIRPPEP